MNLRKFYNKLKCFLFGKLKCFLFGHEPYVSEKWYTWITVCRKGGKRRGKGVHRKWHKKVHCARCGKLLKQK